MNTVTVKSDVETEAVVPCGTADVPHPASGILNGMAMGNVDQAARLLRINATGMALWHLREAIQQLEEAQQFSGLQTSNPGPVIEATTPEHNGN